ncbi:hypothetical protein DTO271G3_1722 [Paecilomyces variotii]|nr:hypothetical protein DTO271G3_1722 [Paecilomyces variotii]
MSTATIPLGPKTDSPSASPRKRKTLLELDSEKISEILRDLNDEDIPTGSDGEHMLALINSFTSNNSNERKELLKSNDEFRKWARPVIGVSLKYVYRAQNLSHAVRMFSLEYLEDAPYIWKVPEGPDLHLSNEAEALLTKMRRARFWGDRGSAEGLSRTLIDIVLFDRMEAHQEELAARKLSVRGEVHLEASIISSEKEIIVVGNADYALGYNPVIPMDLKGFESISVVVEAKRETDERQAVGIAQAVAYMTGSACGFLAHYEFRIQINNPPFTEPPIFGRPTPPLQQLLDTPEADFLSPVEDYDNIELQGVEKFDVQRPGPSEVKAWNSGWRSSKRSLSDLD